MRWGRLGGGRIGIAVTVLALAWAWVIHTPAALAFPHRAQIGETAILSERPIDPAMTTVLARADRLVRESPLAAVPGARTVVLTDGGWRWRVMAAMNADSFALRRPFSSALVFNRSDVAADRVWAGVRVGEGRPLSAVIAHETTHLLVARRLGELRAMALPMWKSEGLADYVARNSNLSDAAAARVRASGKTSVPLRYYDARRRVAAVLRAHGGDVEALWQ